MKSLLPSINIKLEPACEVRPSNNIKLEPSCDVRPFNNIKLEPACEVRPSNNIKLEPACETENVQSSTGEIISEDQVFDKMDSKIPANVKTEYPYVSIDHPDEFMRSMQSLLQSNNIKLEPACETDNIQSSAGEIISEDQVFDKMDSKIPANFKAEQPCVSIDYPDVYMRSMKSLLQSNNIKLEPVYKVRPSNNVKLEPACEVRPSNNIKLEPACEVRPSNNMKLEPACEVRPSNNIKLEPACEVRPSNNIKLEPACETENVQSSTGEIISEDQVLGKIDSKIPASVKTEQPNVYVDYADESMKICPSSESCPSRQEQTQMEQQHMPAYQATTGITTPSTLFHAPLEPLHHYHVHSDTTLATKKSNITREIELVTAKNKLRTVSNNYRKKKQRARDLNSQLQALEEERQNLRTEIVRLQMEINTNFPSRQEQTQMEQQCMSEYQAAVEIRAHSTLFPTPLERPHHSCVDSDNTLATEKSNIRTRELELARVKNKLRTVSNNYRKKKQRVRKLYSQLQALIEERQHLITEIVCLELEINTNLPSRQEQIQMERQCMPAYQAAVEITAPSTLSPTLLERPHHSCVDSDNTLPTEKSDIRTRELELARVKNKLHTVSNNYRKKKQRVRKLYSQLQTLGEERQNLRTDILGLKIEINTNLPSRQEQTQMEQQCMPEYQACVEIAAPSTLSPAPLVRPHHSCVGSDNTLATEKSNIRIRELELASAKNKLRTVSNNYRKKKQCVRDLNSQLQALIEQRQHLITEIVHLEMEINTNLSSRQEQTQMEQQCMPAYQAAVEITAPSTLFPTLLERPHHSCVDSDNTLATEKRAIRTRELELARVKNKLQTVSNNYRKKKQHAQDLNSQLQALIEEEQHLISESVRLEMEINTNLPYRQEQTQTEQQCMSAYQTTVEISAPKTHFLTPLECPHHSCVDSYNTLATEKSNIGTQELELARVTNKLRTVSNNYRKKKQHMEDLNSQLQVLLEERQHLISESVRLEMEINTNFPSRQEQTQMEQQRMPEYQAAVEIVAPSNFYSDPLECSHHSCVDSDNTLPTEKSDKRTRELDLAMAKNKLRTVSNNYRKGKPRVRKLYSQLQALEEERQHLRTENVRLQMEINTNLPSRQEQTQMEQQCMPEYQAAVRIAAPSTLSPAPLEHPHHSVSIVTTN